MSGSQAVIFVITSYIQGRFAWCRRDGCRVWGRKHRAHSLTNAWRAAADHPPSELEKPLAPARPQEIWTSGLVGGPALSVFLMSSQDYSDTQ